MRILFRYGILFLFILTACASHSISGDRRFEGIETAQSATVVLFPMYISSVIALNEEAIKAGGCTYTTRNPVLIANLVKDLQSRVRTVEHPEVGEQEPRELIYLNLASGETVKLWFGPVFSTRTEVRGAFTRAQAHAVVSADLSLPKDLYEWAVRTDENLPLAARSDKSAGCSFVQHYQDYRDFLR